MHNCCNTLYILCAVISTALAIFRLRIPTYTAAALVDAALLACR